jgi:hypothetical protein
VGQTVVSTGCSNGLLIGAHPHPAKNGASSYVTKKMKATPLLR